MKPFLIIDPQGGTVHLQNIVLFKGIPAGPLSEGYSPLEIRNLELQHRHAPRTPSFFVFLLKTSKLVYLLRNKRN